MTIHVHRWQAYQVLRGSLVRWPRDPGEEGEPRADAGDTLLRCERCGQTVNLSGMRVKYAQTWRGDLPTLWTCVPTARPRTGRP